MVQMRRFVGALGWLVAWCACAFAGALPAAVAAQTSAVTAEVSVSKPGPAGHPHGTIGNRADESQGVVWLGSLIQFPNRDPFFQNIFSMCDGKRFVLGLYEPATSRSVRFDRPGVS